MGLYAHGMNPWLWAAVVVCLCLVPCADMSLRGDPQRRMVGVQMTGFICTIAGVLLTLGTGRLIMIEIPMAMAIMSFGGGLVYIRFLEKHL